MGGVEKISSKCCKLFKREKLVLQVFFKASSFKVKVCGREFFDSLKVWNVWEKKGLSCWKCEVSSVPKNFLHCCKFQVKFQACVIKDLQVIEVFSFQLYVRGQRFSLKAFNLL